MQCEENLDKISKENAKLKKRLQRIIDQGDRQHKEIEKLNEHLHDYIGIIDENVITVTIDRNKVIKSVSTAFSNSFGFKAKEVIGQRYDYLLDQEYGERFFVDIDDSAARRQSWHGELKHVTKAESVIWTNTVVMAIYDDAGEVQEYTIISKDITDEINLQKLKAQKASERTYTQSTLDFMSSKSSALLLKTAKNISVTLWLLLAAIIWFLIWASYAEIDELARGRGKILPAMQLQKIQSVDKGRIQALYFKEGDFVKKGDVLFKLNDVASSNSYEQNRARLYELNAKKLRLEAEASGQPFILPKKLLSKDEMAFVKQEYSLNETRRRQLQSNLDVLNQKIYQQKNKLKEAKAKFKALYENLNLLNQEIAIKKDLLAEQIISQVEYLQLTRQKNELLLDVNSVENEITNIESIIKETKDNLAITKLQSVNTAKKELNDVMAEIDRLKKSQATVTDQLQRTTLYAPVDGVINKVTVTTIGEVVEAGKVLAEIVPSSSNLIAEIKINPSDIAYIREGQKALVKVTSYDFSIYGGLDAKIIYVSADTTVDATDGESYYTVQLETEKSYLGTEEKPMYIKVGMIVDADIVLGRKSIMNYILKPIMKAKQQALSER